MKLRVVGALSLRKSFSRIALTFGSMVEMQVVTARDWKVNGSRGTRITNFSKTPMRCLLYGGIQLEQQCTLRKRYSFNTYYNIWAILSNNNLKFTKYIWKIYEIASNARNCREMIIPVNYTGLKDGLEKSHQWAS